MFSTHSELTPGGEESGEFPAAARDTDSSNIFLPLASTALAAFDLYLVKQENQFGLWDFFRKPDPWEASP